MVDLNIEKSVLDLNAMDNLVVNDDQGEGLSDKRKEATNSMWQHLRYKESLLRQI